MSQIISIPSFRKCFFTLAMFFLAQNLAGQTLIKGIVTDTKGKAIPNINILIYQPGSSVIKAFSVTNGSGLFQFNVDNKPDSLNIKVSSVQYHNVFRHIANTSQNLKFVLKEDVINLKTITVTARPIEQHGDTLKFYVSMFAKKEDRSIEDVLRHMPGVEVQSNGQILYQGVPLQKFYVEGLDLMGGRYGVVTKNLPAMSVSTVEIMENDQPIKILKGRVPSNRASMNLKLKRDVSVTGTAKLGAGFSPFLRDINISPMVFTKKFQMLASYQSNNAGKDVSKQLNMLTVENLIRNLDRPSGNPGIPDLVSPGTPEIDESRFLDNNVNLLNFNGLVRLNHEFQLRTNLYYINDIQRQQGSIQRTLYSPSDTLSYTENLNDKIHNNYLHGEFTLTRNVKSNYLEDKLKFETTWDNKSGMVHTENESVSEALKNPYRTISNELSSINSIGKQLVEFNSYLSYDKSPHDLQVTPGQFAGVLNGGSPYQEVYQNLNLKRFYTEESGSFVINWKRFSITPKMGFSYRQEQLKSNIVINQTGKYRDAGPGFQNNTTSSHTRIYLNPGIEYNYAKLSLRLKLPISWQQVLTDDSVSGNRQELHRILFNPSLSARYKINGFWNVYSSIRHTNRLGNIENINYGYILKNYRLLSQNDAPVSQTSTNSIAVSLSYKNPITSFFNSISYFYNISNNNLIYTNTVQTDGTTVLQAMYLPNKTYSHNLHAQTSKYYSSAKTTLGLQFNLSHTKGKTWLNNDLFNITNLFYNFVPDVNVLITKWLNADYSLNAQFIKTFIENQKRSTISMIRNKLDVFAFPKDNQLISVSSEYYNYMGTRNFFMDLLYRYTITKRKIDIEFRWNNIFDTRNYVSYQSSDFMILETSYLLRPSQVLLSVKFSF